MKKATASLLIFVSALIFMTGCSSLKQYSGESKHWKGTFSLTQNREKEIGEGALQYKGNDKKKLGKVKWRVEGTHSSLSGEMEETNGEIPLNQNCTNCAMQNEEEAYQVFIEWNGKTEAFQMKPH